MAHEEHSRQWSQRERHCFHSSQLCWFDCRGLMHSRKKLRRSILRCPCPSSAFLSVFPLCTQGLGKNDYRDLVRSHLQSKPLNRKLQSMLQRLRKHLNNKNVSRLFFDDRFFFSPSVNSSSGLGLRRDAFLTGGSDARSVEPSEAKLHRSNDLVPAGRPTLLWRIPPLDHPSDPGHVPEHSPSEMSHLIQRVVDGSSLSRARFASLQ